jgi:hypothetical protein
MRDDRNEDGIQDCLQDGFGEGRKQQGNVTGVFEDDTKRIDKYETESHGTISVDMVYHAHALFTNLDALEIELDKKTFKAS